MITASVAASPHHLRVRSQSNSGSDVDGVSDATSLASGVALNDDPTTAAIHSTFADAAGNRCVLAASLVVFCRPTLLVGLLVSIGTRKQESRSGVRVRICGARGLASNNCAAGDN